MPIWLDRRPASRRLGYLLLPPVERTVDARYVPKKKDKCGKNLTKTDEKRRQSGAAPDEERPDCFQISCPNFRAPLFSTPGPITRHGIVSAVTSMAFAAAPRNTSKKCANSCRKLSVSENLHCLPPIRFPRDGNWSNFLDTISLRRIIARFFLEFSRLANDRMRI